MNIPVTKKTVVRLASVAIGSFAFVYLIPAASETGAQGFGSAVPGILASVVLGILISHAAERRRGLIQTVNLELNKLRRIYHLSKNMADIDSQRYRGWFTDLHGFLYRYMIGFTERDFNRYEESDRDFRSISYHIYRVPELRSSKEESLYDELLRTIATVAESRQQIKEARESRLSAYSWVAVLLLVAGAIAAACLSMGAFDTSRISTGICVAGFCLAVDLLWEVDTLASERKEIARRYVDNIGRIELRRREDE